MNTSVVCTILLIGSCFSSVQACGSTFFTPASETSHSSTPIVSTEKAFSDIPSSATFVPSQDTLQVATVAAVKNIQQQSQVSTPSEKNLCRAQVIN